MNLMDFVNMTNLLVARFARECRTNLRVIKGPDKWSPISCKEDRQNPAYGLPKQKMPLTWHFLFWP